jgi:predicted HicB family RNase H-like nuclease
MTTKKEPRSATVQLRIPPSLKTAAEAAARADRRSLTGLIEKLLADYVEKEGFSHRDAA